MDIFLDKQISLICQDKHTIIIFFKQQPYISIEKLAEENSDFQISYK